jgi:general secretion pathway protein L
MTVIEKMRHELGTWMTSVAEAVVSASHRVRVEHRVCLLETEPDVFVMRMTATPKRPAPSEYRFTLLEDEPDPALPGEWAAALEGSRLDVTFRPQRFLFRPLDLPRRAADFLDGMIRSQIDRLTPWTAGEAVYGWSAPVEIVPDRIRLTIAASPKSKVMPFVRLAEAWRVGSVALSTTGEAEAAGLDQIKIIEKRLRGSLEVDPVRRVLSIVLLATTITAALSYIAADAVGWQLEAQQQQISSKISARRAAMRLGVGKARDSAQAILVRRKQVTPSCVMVLEALSDILPDNTYVTEFRIDKDKLQVVGLTVDAPSLVNLLEQSPQFTRVTFFAPTTRSPADPGERFHVEAHLKPYFGPGP